MLAIVQNYLRMPKPGCSFWGGRRCCLQRWHPWGQIPMAALTAGVMEHKSSINHIPRGCPDTSGNWHGQRALALPGAGSCSYRARSPVPCASIPQASVKGSPPGTKALGLAALWGGIRLPLLGWWQGSVSCWLQDLLLLEAGC